MDLVRYANQRARSGNQPEERVGLALKPRIALVALYRQI